MECRASFKKGHYVLLVSVYHRHHWSPWLLYAVWGRNEQYSFHDQAPHIPIRSYQDQVELLDGEIATRFRIRLEARVGASLKNFYSLHACLSRRHMRFSIEPPPQRSSIYLSMQGLSQFSLEHPRAKDLCSPTSTTAVIRYLLPQHSLDPLDFAKQSYDAGFDIYGNWSFNVAQAFVELKRRWQCFYARSKGFEEVYHYLEKRIPAVVSVQGKLSGCVVSYARGHLVVIIGYDAKAQQIMCMDPAFPSHQQALISYPFEEFMQAWLKRRYLAYFFTPILKPM